MGRWGAWRPRKTGPGSTRRVWRGGAKIPQRCWRRLCPMGAATRSGPCIISWSAPRSSPAHGRPSTTTAPAFPRRWPNSTPVRFAYRELRARSGACAAPRPLAAWRLPFWPATRPCALRDGARVSSWSRRSWPLSLERGRLVAANEIRASPFARLSHGLTIILERV